MFISIIAQSQFTASWTLQPHLGTKVESYFPTGKR